LDAPIGAGTQCRLAPAIQPHPASPARSLYIEAHLLDSTSDAATASSLGAALTVYSRPMAWDKAPREVKASDLVWIVGR